MVSLPTLPATVQLPTCPCEIWKVALVIGMQGGRFDHGVDLTFSMVDLANCVHKSTLLLHKTGVSKSLISLSLTSLMAPERTTSLIAPRSENLLKNSHILRHPSRPLSCRCFGKPPSTVPLRFPAKALSGQACAPQCNATWATPSSRPHIHRSFHSTSQTSEDLTLRCFIMRSPVRTWHRRGAEMAQ